MSELLLYLCGDDTCDWQLTGNEPGKPFAQSGESTPHIDLPAASLSSRTIAIVPAWRMRTLALALPPTPADKRLAVVRFALEDQLAGDVDAQHVVIAREQERGAVVHAIDRPWLLRMLEQLSRQGLRPARIVAESDLVTVSNDALGTWVWRDDGGFLVETSGRVSILDRGDDALPSGLLLVLRHAGAGANRIVVCAPEPLAQQFAAWSHATGAQFEREPAWTWRSAHLPAIESAPDLLTRELESGSIAATRRGGSSWLRRAMFWAGAALLLHAGASVADWVGAKWGVAQVERETRQLIQAAAPELTGDLDAGWRRAYAASRHRTGRVAPDDALPMLADTAAGLTDLPAGALRVINYEAGQLTLDFDKTGGLAVDAAMPVWDARGLSVLRADVAGGLRARLTRR